MIGQYIKHKVALAFAATLAMWAGSCKAADVTLSCPADSVQVICPQTISTSTPSPLVWASTQTQTAELTLLGGDYIGGTAPALTAPALNGVVAGAKDSANLMDPTGQVAAYSDQNTAVMAATAFGSGPGIFSAFKGASAEGTQASPLASIPNDDIGLIFSGYNGAGFTGSKARILMGPSENWSGGANGTQIKLQTTLNGTTTVKERVRVANDGHVGLGNTAPQALLHMSSGTILMDGTGAPATGGGLCLNASGRLSKCTTALDASGNCTCP